METVLVNAVGRVRHESIAGREYLVAPLTLIVPGVLRGSQGAVLYESEDIRLSAHSWNGVPMIVYHPQRGNQYVSARDPEFASRWIGIVFNTRFVDGKLTAEGWFDKEATRRVDSRVSLALEQGQPIELSTGLYTRNVPVPKGMVHNSGVDGPVPYDFVAKEYKPDHLAVLPDQKGACSLRHGCGVLANQEDGTVTETSPSKENVLSKQQLIEWLVANCDCWKGEAETLAKFTDAKLASLKAHVEQEKQYEIVANAALQGFNDGQIGAKYDPQQGKFVVTNTTQPKTVADFSNEELQREVLKRLNPQQNPAPNPTQQGNPQPVVNMTPQDLFKMFPPDFQEAVQEGQIALSREKQQLVQRLTTNVSPERKAEATASLMSKKVSELREIASLLPPVQQSQDPVQTYFGITGAPVPTVNYEEDKDNLPFIPQFSFGK